jgi:hypothetical protein
MSDTVCSLFPGPSLQARHRRDRLLPLEHAEYALSDRWLVACVLRLCAPTIAEDALPSWQLGHNYSCTRGSPLSTCDWEYHADLRA